MPKKYRFGSDPEPAREPEGEDKKEQQEQEEGEVVYLPGASKEIPGVTWMTGWPQQLSDKYDIEYWRLRDGSGVNGQGAVLYGKIVGESGGKPVVDGGLQYIPTMQSHTTEDVIMSAGPWYAAPDLEDTFIRRVTT